MALWQITSKFMRSIHIGQYPFAQAKWVKRSNPRDLIDAYHYPNRTGAAVFSLLRTIAMNLLRIGGYRSIRHGLRELAYDIKGMLALGGVTTAGTTA